MPHPRAAPRFLRLALVALSVPTLVAAQESDAERFADRVLALPDVITERHVAPRELTEEDRAVLAGFLEVL